MNIVLIVASGNSKRLKGKTNKLFLPINGKPLLYYTIAVFYDHPEIDKLVITVNAHNRALVSDLLDKYYPNHKEKVRLTAGGEKRAISVKKGVDFIVNSIKPTQEDTISIHNGANPLVTVNEISKCIKKAKEKGSCIVTNPIKGTIKEASKTRIHKTHNRELFVEAQTPQTFLIEVLKESYKAVGNKYVDLTDEASLVENAGFKVLHIPASSNNFKITNQKDFEHLKYIMGDLPDDYIVGIGQDSHHFSTKKGLVLGGLVFEDELKLEANSDGDVLLHALCNALLQAIGEKSLGSFADDLCLNKGIKDSQKYLEVVLRKMKRKNYSLNNIGCMIEGKKPKIDLVSGKLKDSISMLTGLSSTRIGVTATSGEKLTSFGKGKGIQCFCIVSLKKT